MGQGEQPKTPELALLPTSDLRPWPADNIERWPIASIKPYPRNARTHSDEQIEQIAASMTRFGVTAPVLVDEAGVLIYGHGRLRAAQLLGYADLPVAVARGWTEPEKAAYRIADNQLGLLSEWDLPLLRSELAQLSLEAFDLPLIGFPEAKLGAMLAGPAPPEQFGTYGENIAVQHTCPACGYAWSGRPDAGAQRETPAEGKGDAK